MRRKLFPLVLALFMIFPSWMALAANEGQDGITRGDFFNLVADHLQLTAQDKAAALPADVSADGTYADSVRALMEQKIVVGYPDGTIGGDNALTAQEATLVLGRLLGVSDAEAARFLNDTFQLSINSGGVSLDAAQEAVKRVLTSDPQALELVKQSTEKQLAIDSFRSDIEQTMTIHMGDVPGMAPLPSNIPITSKMEYHKDQGIRQTVTMNMAGFGDSESGEQTMSMEQYIVPEGIYMSTVNPATGEEQWMKMGNELPFSFEELAAMQQQSAQLNDSFIDKHFFYRYDGEETVEGRTLQKVSFNGQLASFAEIMKLVEEMMPEADQASLMMGEMGDMFNGSMTMSGTMWFDAETQLPVKSDMDMNIHFGNTNSIPFESMEMTMSAVFYDYGEVDGIVLPEEAKDAVDLTEALEEVTETE